MNARRVLTVAGLFAAAAVLWAAFGPAGAQQEKKKAEPAPPVARWEYKVVMPERSQLGQVDPAKTEEALNKLGADGWEISKTVSEVSGSEKSTRTRTLLILKRPKP